jgi:hypothetical protein
VGLEGRAMKVQRDAEPPIARLADLECVVRSFDCWGGGIGQVGRCGVSPELGSVARRVW